MCVCVCACVFGKCKPTIAMTSDIGLEYGRSSRYKGSYPCSIKGALPANNAQLQGIVFGQGFAHSEMMFFFFYALPN